MQPASTRCTRCSRARRIRLTCWRVAADDINYRRFFDINELAALRAEDPQVFDDSHRLVLRLVAERKIDALRIDHPDGLYDPKAYFERLQAAVRSALLSSAASARSAEAPRRRPRSTSSCEKILAEHETLPADWPVQGTTGYRFANLVDGLLVDGAAKSRFDRVYAAFIGGWVDFDQILREAKLLIMAGGARVRPEPARARTHAHRRGRPQHARSYVQRPASHGDALHRGAAGLPHLHRRSRSRRGRPALHRLGDRHRPAMASGARSDRFRFPSPTC